MEDDFYTRNEMATEVTMRSVWRERSTKQVVRLVHYFRDDENRKMDVIFAKDGAASGEGLCYKEFQKRYEKV